MEKYRNRPRLWAMKNETHRYRRKKAFMVEF